MGKYRMKVLEMLAEGKITADEASRLLERLDARREEATSTGPPGEDIEEGASMPAADRPIPREPRFLRFVVHSQNGDRVNARIPMALVKAGVKMSALLPEEVVRRLESNGVHVELDPGGLGRSDGEQLVKSLAALSLDVDSQNGDRVRIFCE